MGEADGQSQSCFRSWHGAVAVESEFSVTDTTEDDPRIGVGVGVSQQAAQSESTSGTSAQLTSDDGVETTLRAGEPETEPSACFRAWQVTVMVTAESRASMETEEEEAAGLAEEATGVSGAVT